MTHKEIQDLIKLVGKSDLSEFKIKDGDFELLLRSKEYFKCKKDNMVAMPAQVPSFMPMPGQAAPIIAPVNEAISGNLPDSGENNDSDNGYLEVKSPIVGTFYRSASPDKPAFVKVGDKINVGDTVCIVEAMKLFNEIESEVSGTIVKVLIEDASPVEYDKVLFLVDPNA